MNPLGVFMEELAAGLVALTLASATPLLAQESMGREPGIRLLTRCEAARLLTQGQRGLAGLSADQLADARACLAFMDGFVWGHAWASWRGAKDMWFCLPEGFSARQGVLLVLDYLEAHPDRLAEETHLLVFLALTAAYPCQP